ncbi:unnamed protein product [Enterobius vermicularis]|uniref:G_PROTEIN_RECEP_F1_2 domain-containing protein n=1 Tax=Enterobius vermicularis TaxID=51028 RepID=A0A0N4VQ47_ENTVE|nr:unnamed protein product [Enterobius vermicularis]
MAVNVGLVKISKQLVADELPQRFAVSNRLMLSVANDVLPDKCFPLEQLRFSGSNFEYFVFTVLFPPICFFGITGNILNLVVLLSKEIRSR